MRADLYISLHSFLSLVAWCFDHSVFSFCSCILKFSLRFTGWTVPRPLFFFFSYFPHLFKKPKPTHQKCISQRSSSPSCLALPLPHMARETRQRKPSPRKIHVRRCGGYKVSSLWLPTPRNSIVSPKITPRKLRRSRLRLVVLLRSFRLCSRSPTTQFNVPFRWNIVPSYRLKDVLLNDIALI
jgi:hypothetical protein